MQNNEKTILVTGASKGIGQAIALAAAQAGYTLVIHYNRDRDSALQTQRDIETLGGEARLLSFDVSDRATCHHILEADIQEYGAYYGAILNAGITRDNAFPALEDDDWDKVIHTNLDSFYNVLKPIIMPMIRTRKPGRIITLSSVSGLVGNRGQVNYSASKAGIIGATKALALELASRHITVNCIAPGVIETQMVKDIPLDHIIPLIPMGRMGQPAEVAATAVFLLSEAAGYITRQVISVSGGLV
ncbi:3-oxoacyl-ACP reductase FabG [Candidatus Odyssella acanthamoebae]|uniref:3-ketoacyl-ACP reductase n=1 Tax=Candidatus Odyssella acanthamoebae TaxID=91604 RepID=A0A077AT45_9PROT|nr:3-oxoacyl-ACP reductase FabG [Candidatus Paracaedibacter acanthamoebae]AIK96377.1 3-ketoacyl-ACP reductase [Candidatus Paracaedibacter acanthamoebae]